MEMVLGLWCWQLTKVNFFTRSNITATNQNIFQKFKPSRKHLRTKVTPDFNLTYSKNWGKSGVGIKIIKNDNFHYFSIKSYVVNVY